MDPGSLPAHFAVAFGLCLAISALGFVRVDYFVSLGYGFSIAAQALLFLIIYRGAVDPWTAAQVMLLLAYGLRLGGYLIVRERSPSFARELEASRERGERVRGGLRIVIWVSVAALYVAMFSPGLYSLWEQAHGASLGSIAPGIVVMVAGLGLEALADWQKAGFKAKAPSRFVSGGVYRLVRYPNYFGEMVFWLGAWGSGLSAYQSPLAWLVSIAGLVCIELVMLGSARRLEIKQGERYGGDADYQRYLRKVPVLIPLLPLYSVRNVRFYLG